MGRMGLQEILAAQEGQVSKEREGNQELLASGRASEALKETRGSMDSLENPATWGSQGPLGPQGATAPQD